MRFIIKRDMRLTLAVSVLNVCLGIITLHWLYAALVAFGAAWIALRLTQLHHGVVLLTAANRASASSSLLSLHSGNTRPSGSSGAS